MRTTLLKSITGALLLAAQVHAAVPPSPADAPQAKADEQQAFKTAKEKISYTLGVDMIRNFKRQAIDADLAAVIRGMQEESSGKKLQLSEAEIKKTLKDYNVELKNKQALQRQLTSEQNKRDGQAFFLANKDKKGVVTIPNGLQYKIIKAGDGVKPSDNDAVTLRYRGTLLDGTEIDSSEDLGYPVTFFVKDSVIDGWKEALKRMPAGSKWQVFVPPHLGFGEKGAGRDIGPNVTLIYEIDLLAVNPQPAPPKKKE
jgi:FKBP-type peptidyl-prolyl cis-trans isomerase FklB